MQITTVAIFLFAAMGAVATPIEPESNGLDARAEASTLLTYTGDCFKDKNECKYQGEGNKDLFIKCPSAHNLRCTKDGNRCEFDSYSRKVTCN